ncbi:MAG: phosphatase PAP2 family protein [Candidatus Gracilibacteria bacterium]|nr:phosphatase PAP2 family protein [Candidatus Gracilibacteria bacterium]
MNLFLFLHQNFNKPLSLYLNSFTDNKLIGDIVYCFADVPIFILPIFLIGAWLYFNYKKNINGKNKLLFIFYSIFIAVIINIIIQHFIHIDRPEESLKNAGKLILNHIPDNSFPSDHASVGSAFLVSLFLFGFVRIGLIILPFIIVMLLSRIAGGIHWPFDIIVGIIIGSLSSFIIYKIHFLNIFKKVNILILKFSSFFKL